MRLRPILWLAAAGLLSAIFGISVIQFTFYAAGAWFGVATAICLKKFGIFDDRQTSRFVVVSIVAYVASFALALKLSGAFPPVFYSPPEHEASIVFVGAGVLGGLLLIGGTICVARPGLSGVGVVVSVISGTLCGGLLARLGQVLGPSVGFAVMKMLAPLPWFPVAYEYQDFYAILLLWQTGMALLLGVLLEGFRSKSPARHLAI